MIPLPDGCDSLAVLELAVTAVNVGVSQNGAFLVSSQNAGPWQWVDCDNDNAPIPGATGQYFTATESGNYAVLVQNAGCADTSACYQVILSGIEEALLDAIGTWYDAPNDRIVVILGNGVGPIDLGIFDASGRALTSTGRLAVGRHEVLMAAMPPGVYVMRFSSDQGNWSRRIVKP
jgi:hypothetical protein